MRYINEEENSKFAFISIVLLQVNVNDGYIDIFFLSIETILQSTILIVTFKIYVLNEEIEPKEFTMEAINSYNERFDIYYYYIMNYDNEEFNKLFSEKGKDNLRVVINNIEFKNDEVENFNELYKLDLHLGVYADSLNKPNFDFSNIISYHSDINIKSNIYKVKGISSCEKDYKFNLTLDKNIDIDEKKINIVFKGNDSKKTYTINAECILTSKYNNLIVCQVDYETKDLSYIMNDYLTINSNELLFIYCQKNSTLPLFCYEKAPILGIVFIVGVFIFIVIIIFIIIILVNKKGKDSQKYDYHKNFNDNKVFGISSGIISK